MPDSTSAPLPTFDAGHASPEVEHRAREILESISDAFFALDGEWRFTYLNRQATHVLGRQPGELLGKLIWTEYPDAIGTDFERVYRAVGATGVAESFTAFFPPHDRWYEVNAYPAPHGISVYFRDVTPRVRAEESRQKLMNVVARQATIFDTTLSNINDFVYTLDRAGRFTYANRPLLNLWGLTAEEALGKTFGELNYPEELSTRLHREVEQVFQTRKPLVSETALTSRDGRLGHYEYIFAPVLSADGAVELIAGSTRVITARKELTAERERLMAALENERARLAAIVEQSPAFICTLRGPDHVYELANERYYELVGRRQLIGLPVRTALPEIEGQGYFELLDRVYQSGETFAADELPAHIHRGDGALEERFVNLVYQAMRDAGGNVTGIFVHGFDATDFVRSRQALQESEARFRLIADAMPQIVWVTDAAGYHEYYNRRWYEYLGMNFDETKGSLWAIALHPDDQERSRDRWQQSLESGQPYEIEYRFRRADGAYRWFLGRALPVRDEAGQIVKWYGTCTDIDDQRRLREENLLLLDRERLARVESERAGQMKDEFLATLSHELRTPLSAILGWSQILQRSNQKPETLRQGLDTIERNARAQTQIIEDLLDMSRIISGKINLTVKQTDLLDIVDAAMGTVRAAAAAKEIDVRIDERCEAHCIVMGDPNRLQQVFWNLLSNAIKFTPRGGVVKIGVKRHEGNWQIEVTDSGEGIAADFLPYVFDRFRQADASTTRRHGGLGLGLSIVKQLVDLHGGSVRVDSAGKGHGATFTVRVPIPVLPGLVTATSSDGPTEIATNVVDGPLWDADVCDRMRGAKAIVVDDEPDARALLKQLLESCGMTVAAAGSAPEALALMKLEPPDVLISDIGMPGEDGYSLLRRVRALGANDGRDVPAIALTAYARTEDRVNAIRAGFQMHVPKPVEPAELVVMVASLISRSPSTLTSPAAPSSR